MAPRPIGLTVVAITRGVPRGSCRSSSSCASLSSTARITSRPCEKSYSAGALKRGRHSLISIRKQPWRQTQTGRSLVSRGSRVDGARRREAVHVERSPARPRLAVHRRRRAPYRRRRLARAVPNLAVLPLDGSRPRRRWGPERAGEDGLRGNRQFGVAQADWGVACAFGCAPSRQARRALRGVGCGSEPCAYAPPAAAGSCARTLFRPPPLPNAFLKAVGNAPRAPAAAAATARSHARLVRHRLLQ